jgi:anthranilate phosphoribosyltransferase
MGVEQALVVHGSGLDEVALHGETLGVRLAHGEISHCLISPEDAGLERAPLNVVTGGDPAENAARLRTLLEGRGSLDFKDEPRAFPGKHGSERPPRWLRART